MIEKIKDFKNNKVWVTRKSRILAESRVLHRNGLSSFLLIWYSFFLICYSILELEKLIISEFPLTLMMSIGVFVMSIYIPTIGYAEKSQNYKRSYIKLESIESRLEDLIILIENKQITDNIAQTKYKKLKKEYNNNLKETLNHLDIDYIKLKQQLNRSLSLKEILLVLRSYFYLFLYGISLIILPIIILVVYLNNVT